MADTDLTNPVTRCPKLERFGGMTPLGRPGQPVELASIYVQLPPPTQAMRRDRSMAPPVAPGNRSCGAAA